jgi:hypothetical protein
MGDMTTSVRRLVPWVLACVMAANSAGAQQPPSLSRTAAKVKAKVERLTPQDHISVIPLQGEEEFGSFLSDDPQQFTFYDIDQKRNVSLRYEDVRKVKDGYGGYNPLARKHTDHTRAVVVGVVFAVVLGTLTIFAARS